MTVLLLRFAGPMQAWGVDSRFARRETLREPTKSGVLGLLAAAKGIRRTDSIEELLALRFGVRTDQPGRVMRDFHTAQHRLSGSSMPLSERFYLSDAVFVAGVEGETNLLEGLAEAVDRPVFPLSLGRRSCPVTGKVVLGLTELPLDEALRASPWEASRWYRRTVARTVRLSLHLDGADESGDLVRDVPVSFDPRRREHSWRTVQRSEVEMDNPDGRDQGIDFFAAAGGN